MRVAPCPMEVSSLMQQIADEHGLEFAAALPEANQEKLPEVEEKASSVNHAPPVTLYNPTPAY
jgi:hypothetical protein